MPYQVVPVTVPPAAERPKIHLQIESRPIDKATVVTECSLPQIQVRDVLVSLNGINLYNVEGGISRIWEIIRECQNSEMKIVIHRVDEVPNSWTPYQCNVIDQHTNSQCKNNIHSGHNPFRVCKRHNPQKLCSKSKCTKQARRGTKFCDSHNTNKKILCSFCVDPNTKEMCQNIARSGGLCTIHGPYGDRRCNKFRGGKRCILTRIKGTEYCGRCSDAPTNTACQEDECTCNATFGVHCEEHYPPRRLYQRMKQIIKDLESHMSEKQHKVALRILEINRMLIEDRFQDKNFSLDHMISELAVEIVGAHLNNEKYQDKEVWNCEFTKMHSLQLHLHQRVCKILNVAFSDLRVLFEYMERKLAAESRLYKANAAKVELETRDLQRNYAVRDLCDRSKRRFAERHLPTNPKRVRAVYENEALVKSVVSSSYTGTEVAPPLFSQDINEELEQMFPNEDYK